MKKRTRLFAAIVATVMLVLSLSLASCKPEEDTRPVMPIQLVGYIADVGKAITFSQLEEYKYEAITAADTVLCYFELSDKRFTLFVGLTEGVISYIMLSHNNSSEKLYIFHNNPAALGEDAMEYTGEASSYDVEDFIKEMTEE